jgi:serine/threonine protein kinase, bacterial
MALYCPSCGAENRDHARFCMQCAAALTPEVRCPACGTVNPAQAKFCLNCAAPLRGATPPAGLTGMLPANALLNTRYLILRRVGKGGMGAVYQAADTRLSSKVWALKEMSDAAILDPAEKQQARDAFQREAQMLALLDHPNLPKVNDFFIEGGKLYLVMDFINGQTLEDLLDHSASPLPEAQVLPWAGQLCDVLDYLHRCAPPIIFRDLKPGNIMLDRSGRVKLIDFGVARLFKTGQARDTANFGTAGYAPPEQYGKGQTDARSDVYALGVTLHQLLTRYDPALTPFNLPPVRNVNPAVSAHVEQAILKATQAAQASRYQRALEFKAALLTTPTPPVKSTVAPTPPPTFQPRLVAKPARINPTVVSPPIAAPRASNKVLLRVSGTIGLLLVSGMIGLLLGISSAFATTRVDEFGLPFWFAAGPLAYALFRRSSAFSIAWFVATAIVVQATLSEDFMLGLPLEDFMLGLPLLVWIPIFGFPILASRRSQGASIKFTAFVTTLTVVAIWFVYYGLIRDRMDNEYLKVGLASLVGGFLGGWLGHAIRNRVGWA